jgi:hypothetical protein
MVYHSEISQKNKNFKEVEMLFSSEGKTIGGQQSGNRGPLVYIPAAGQQNEWILLNGRK